MPSAMESAEFRQGYFAGWNDALEFVGVSPSRTPTSQYGNLPMELMPLGGGSTSSWPTPPQPPQRKRKVSAYHKRLGREIKRLRRMHLTKAGKWKKGWNQRRLMKQAHKNTK